VDYLEHGGAVYIEGNDFARDHRAYDLWDYFHANFEHDGVNGEVSRLDSDEDCRFGERSFGFPGGTYTTNIPDRISAMEESEAIFYDQTGNDNRVRGVLYYGEYRTYTQSVCFIGMDNSRDHDRADFLNDVLTELTGYGGTFTGRVVNNMTDEPVDGAEIFINECATTAVTDENGSFRIEGVPVESFTVNVSRWGYTPIMEADFTFDGEMELDVEIRMLHPEMAIDPTEVVVDLEEGHDTDFNVAVRNEGDGPLEFSSSVRGARAEGDLWEQMAEMDAGEITGDPRLQDVLYFQGYLWFVGGQTSREPNMLYKVTLDGELVESWVQQSYSNYGWRNITTDGEYLYGVDSTYIAQIDPESGQVTGVRIPTGLNPCYCITWDAEDELFWVSSVATDIYGIDREGNRVSSVNNDRRFRMSGIAWFEDDPDGYKLYTINNLRDDDGNSFIRLIKVNPEDGDAITVADLPALEGERSGGCSFCNEIYDFTWAFLVQMQAAEDWLRVYEASSDFYWLNVEPLEGYLAPDEDMDISMEFSTGDLEANETYRAYMQISHNTPVEGPLWIDIVMNVTEADHGVSSEADVPLEYGLTSVYPNPFNAAGAVSFTLDRATSVALTVHDLTGRQVAVLADGYMSSGAHTVSVDGSGWSSGTYLVRLSDESRVSIRKIALLK